MKHFLPYLLIFLSVNAHASGLNFKKVLPVLSSDNTVLACDASFAGGMKWTASGGGSPGGSNTQLQYNNAGAFGGTTGATTSGGAVTLVAPILGTPASGVLTNCTGLPVAGGGTGVATIADGGLVIGKGTAAIETTGVLAKGTLVVGDGVTNPTTLTVGSNGTVLSADTSTASGLTWATVVPHKTFINFPVHSTKLSADTAVRIDGGFYLWRLLFADGVSGNDKNLCLWQGRMDDNWQGGALTAKIDYHMTSSDSTSTAAGAITFGVSVMAITSGDAAAMLTESFATENSKTQEVPAVVSRDATVTIPLTNLDGLAAGDWFIVRLRRDGADTITGDAACTSFAITQ